MKYKIGLLIVIIIAISQLFKADEIPFKEPTKSDFLLIESPKEEVVKLMQNICYDCHSDQIKYPWYNEIAVVSWFLKDHIDDGRKHLNFSEWGKYEKEKKEHKAEECWEEVGEGEMPLESYTFIHRDADLSDNERDLLVGYFKELQSKY